MTAVGVAITPPGTFFFCVRAFPSSYLLRSTGISRVMLRHDSDDGKISMRVMSALAQDSLLPLSPPSDILLEVYVPIDSHCLRNHRIYSHPSLKAQKINLHPKSSCLAYSQLTNPLHLPFRLP